MRERYVEIIRESGANKRTLIESRSVNSLPRLLEAADGKEEIKKSLFAKLRDSELVDVGLDMLSGFGVGATVAGGGASLTGIASIVGVPVATVGAAISLVADLINSVRRAFRGEYFGSVLYLIFAIPVLGDILQGAKFVGGGVKAVVASLKPVLSWMRNTSNAARKMKILKASERLLEIAIEKVPDASKHKEGMNKALEAIASGDVEQAKKIALEIGETSLANELEKIANQGSPGSPKSDGKKNKSIEDVNEARVITIIRESLDEARKNDKSVMKKGGKKAPAGSVATFKKAAKRVKDGEEKKLKEALDMYEELLERLTPAQIMLIEGRRRN